MAEAESNMAPQPTKRLPRLTIPRLRVVSFVILGGLTLIILFAFYALYSEHAMSLRNHAGPSGRAPVLFALGAGFVLLSCGAQALILRRLFQLITTEKSAEDAGEGVESNQRIDAALGSADATLRELQSLRQTANQTTQDAENQSTHLAEVAATLDELTSSTSEIASGAAEAALIASKTKEAALKGSGLAESAATNVQQVAEFTHELNRTVDRLSRRVLEIGEIITLVKDIADQTKLLALNASIEAARGGSKNSGFSVVAAEVRRLAERTVKETVQISTRIRSVQAESERTSQSMQKTASQVEDILRNVKDVLHTLGSIVDISSQSKERIVQIAEAVEFQSKAMARISATMEESSKISVEISRMAGTVHPQVDAIVSTMVQMKSHLLQDASPEGTAQEPQT